MVVRMLDLLSVRESYSNTMAAEILWEVVSLDPKWRWVFFHAFDSEIHLHIVSVKGERSRFTACWCDSQLSGHQRFPDSSRGVIVVLRAWQLFPSPSLLNSPLGFAQSCQTTCSVKKLCLAHTLPLNSSQKRWSVAWWLIRKEEQNKTLLHFFWLQTFIGPLQSGSFRLVEWKWHNCWHKRAAVWLEENAYCVPLGGPSQTRRFYSSHSDHKVESGYIVTWHVHTGPQAFVCVCVCACFFVCTWECMSYPAGPCRSGHGPPSLRTAAVWTQRRSWGLVKTPWAFLISPDEYLIVIDWTGVHFFFFLLWTFYFRVTYKLVDQNSFSVLAFL